MQLIFLLGRCTRNLAIPAKKTADVSVIWPGILEVKDRSSRFATATIPWRLRLLQNFLILFPASPSNYRTILNISGTLQAIFLSIRNTRKSRDYTASVLSPIQQTASIWEERGCASTTYYLTANTAKYILRAPIAQMGIICRIIKN
jgi:hypothetical protein